MSDMIEIRTSYDAQEYMKFNKFHLFKKNRIIGFLPIIIFVLLGLALIVSGDLGGIVFIVIGLLFPLFLLFIMKWTAKRHLKTNKMYESMKNIYFRLDQNSIYNETIADDLKTTMEAKWDKIYRIYESKDSFYLYISNMQAFIIPKKDIITGDVAQLKALFTEKSEEKKLKVKFI